MTFVRTKGAAEDRRVPSGGALIRATRLVLTQHVATTQSHGLACGSGWLPFPPLRLGGPSAGVLPAPRLSRPPAETSLLVSFPSLVFISAPHSEDRQEKDNL